MKYQIERRDFPAKPTTQVADMYLIEHDWVNFYRVTCTKASLIMSIEARNVVSVKEMPDVQETT